MQSVVFAGLVCLLVHYVTAVTELTDATFYSYSQDKEVLLVDFFAPWCSDCKNLDPDFEAAARSLGVRSVDLVKVDCFGAGKGLCATYGVKRWPTLKNFNRGQYTGDYNGGLTAADIAGYITTVENSVIQQGVSPYAAAQPQPSPPLDVTCDTKCKIAKALNNQYLAMKTKKEAFLHSAPAEPTFAAAPVQASVALQPSKEVLNAMECAKCRIMKPADKLSNRCPASLKKSCILAASTRRSRVSKHRITTDTNRISKKAAIQTLTSASNDNVVKMSLKDALIIPPNADSKTDIQLFTGKDKAISDKDVLAATDSRLPTTDDSGDKKGKSFESITKETTKETKENDEEKSTKTTDDADKNGDISTKETLKLLHDADDKKSPVLSVPPELHDKLQTAIKIPPHDSGDKKTSLRRAATKTVSSVQYPTPKVAIKQLTKHKFQPKFAHMKVPPHDSGDKKTDLQATDTTDEAGDSAVSYPSPKLPTNHFYVSTHKVASRPLRSNNAKSTNLAPSIGNMLPQTSAALKAQNLNNRKKQYMVPKLTLKLPLNKKGAVKNVPSIRNFKIVHVPNKVIDKKAALQKMTPREALRIPYDADDKKRSFEKRTKVG